MSNRARVRLIAAIAVVLIGSGLLLIDSVLEMWPAARVLFWGAVLVAAGWFTLDIAAEVDQ